LKYTQHQWLSVTAEGVSGRSLFGQKTLLIPDTETFFRCREFPLAHVKEASLKEAIELDIASWAPWDTQWESYFWPIQIEESWHVAVWIWPRDVLDNLDGSERLAPTHIMPEIAWKIAAINRSTLPAIYVDKANNKKEVYCVLSSSGVPLQLTECASDVESQRFWLSLAPDKQEYPVLEDIAPQPPRAVALKYARQEGVEDWTDPLGWLKPISLVFGVYIFWLLGSSLILWQKNVELSQEAAAARRDAIEVIDQRESVARIHQDLLALRDLRLEQPRFESVLKALSGALPDDAWLEAIDYDRGDGGWINISGQAQQSSGLAAVLEEVPEIENAMFISDIRQDAATGLEPFSIRLKLAAVPL
jgi:hypothetical protein